jgi:nuclear transport factor 2 (NTF2) superfamily protein
MSETRIVTLKNRAQNAEDRAKVINALAGAWERTPGYRLGQLIHTLARWEGVNVLDVEDFRLLEHANVWATKINEDIDL